MYQDVRHHISTCHQCQLWNTTKVEIPPTIRTPVAIFTQVYIDVMFMPEARGYRYLVAARDDLTHVAEGRALRRITSKALSKFIWEEIIFVEQGHFTIREGILKSCEGKVRDWPEKVRVAFFADKVTTRRSTGFSPFYLLYGTHPILPFDLAEATFMISNYRAGISTAELLALRIRQLEKHPEDIRKATDAIRRSRLASKAQFEKRFSHRLRQTPLSPGSLVLVRNSARDAGLSGKYTPRYTGPYVIDRITKGGAYVLRELDGTFLRQGFAAFRLLPYRPRLPKNLDQISTVEVAVQTDPEEEKDTEEVEHGHDGDTSDD
ncbi:hypothetical protein GY45DRAFT_1349828 [Cubamyces sp. BRFM 1775]|nr:hypothetical protein GY45DRAFT_1349828 [Cubamyces sp. BRFM 1775]